VPRRAVPAARTSVCWLLAAAALVLVAAGPADAERKVPRGFFGVNYAGEIEGASTNLQAQQWDRLAKAGVESARVVFNWDLTENHPGVYKWKRIDNAVRFASQRRIQVLPTVLNAPPWARQYPDVIPSPPKDPADYTRFLRKLIGRYGPDGRFWKRNPGVPKKPIRTWQIWNEIDLQFQWYREGSWKARHARAYARLLKASYKAVKAADPKAKVVLSALAIDSWRILDELYDRAPIEGYFDIAALQPQAGSPGFLPTVIKRFRSTLNQHGDKEIPIWGTEMAQPACLPADCRLGYATGYMDNYATNDRGMADHLKAGYNKLARKSFRESNKLQRVYWFTAVSKYRGGFEYDYSGLLWQHNGIVEPKPAFRAYREVARKWEGCKKDAGGNCQ
jgi:hypothetical protein